ncbi:MAG TPA: hypothetical protein VGS41_08120, partial [Chthonomonadales bacterium]|nr:hypothetical protein [Chthonomonadales bacterium]
HIYYGELEGSHLGLMSSHPFRRETPTLGVAMHQLKATALSVTVAPDWKHLAVGLEDNSGRLLGMGLVEQLDLKRRTIGVLSPVRAPGAVKVVRMGVMRVRPNGSELQSLRPQDHF